MVNPFNFSDFLDFSGQRILTHTPKRAAASRKCSEFSESTTRKPLPSGSVECIWPLWVSKAIQSSIRLDKKYHQKDIRIVYIYICVCMCACVWNLYIYIYVCVYI